MLGNMCDSPSDICKCAERLLQVLDLEKLMLLTGSDGVGRASNGQWIARVGERVTRADSLELALVQHLLAENPKVTSTVNLPSTKKRVLEFGRLVRKKSRGLIM